MAVTGGCQEEYDATCNPNIFGGYGNKANPGLWVSKRMFFLPSFGYEDAHPVFCMMSRGPDYNVTPPEDQDYWIEMKDYRFLMGMPEEASSVSAQAAESGQAILVSGWIQNDGPATLDDWYLLPEAELTGFPPGDFAFNYYDASDNLLHQLTFDVSFDDGAGGELAEVPFAWTIPFVDGTSRITLSIDENELGEKQVSLNAPAVSLVAPNGGESLHSQALIQWSGSDADLDTLHYAVLFSQDDGLTWSTLEAGLTGTSYSWDLHGLAPGSQYRVKVIVTDGFNIGEDSSNNSFTILSAQYLPLVVR
jgi:hypothetical protein